VARPPLERHTEVGGGARSAGGRPRLLFLCQSLPYPPDGGLHLRSFNVLRLLAREFDVAALFFYRRSTRPTDQDVRRGLEGVAPYCSAGAHPIPSDLSRMRLIADHMLSIGTGRVYTRYLYRSRSYAEALERLLEGFAPDVVHVDTLDLSGYLPAMRGLPTIVTHHNIESRLLDRRARGETSPFRRGYLRLQSRLMEREERHWAPRLAMNIVVSSEEESLLRRIAPGCRTAVVPNGVDTSVFRPRPEARGRGIVFVGSHGWLPNRDAMDYFAGDILPRVRKALGPVPVTWVGRASPDVRESLLNAHDIRLTGYVDDVRPYVQSAAAYVVPIRIGGGTRLKIVDAWAMGIPIISTTIGCEGLDARDGENILVRDEPEAFADAVIRVLSDRALASSLGSNGRVTAEETYDWDVIGGRMLPLYRACLG